MPAMPHYPNAEIIVHETEAHFWLRFRRPRDRKGVKGNRARTKINLKPYLDRIRRVRDGEEALGFTPIVAPGHTPGHTCWVLASGKESFMALGDVVHLSAIQISHPEAALTYDLDADMAIAVAQAHPRHGGGGPHRDRRRARQCAGLRPCGAQGRGLCASSPRVDTAPRSKIEDAMNPVVAVIAPGMMGAAVGKRLVDNGLKVLTALTGRSAETLARAKDAGMAAASDEEIAATDFILSILPPGDAVGAGATSRAGAVRQQQQAGLCRLQCGEHQDRRAHRGGDCADRLRVRRCRHHRLAAEAGRQGPALIRLRAGGAAFCDADAVRPRHPRAGWRR